MLCPACNRSTPKTAVASRATGRRISVCPTCGVHFWPDKEAADRLAAIETQIDMTADDYSNWVDIKREQVGPDAWHDALGWMRDALPATDHTPVVFDVGSGDGGFLAVARDEYGFDVMGNEIVAGAVALARQRHDIDLHLGDLTALGLTEVADAATLWCVLAHVTDGDQLLRDTHRLLRPGGVLHLQTPHWSWADTAAHGLKRATRGRVSKITDRRVAQHHWILHTRASITAQLNRLGFVDVVAEPQARYTLTSEAYFASMNPPGWALRPLSRTLDAALSAGIAPRIVLDVRARRR